MNMKHSNLLLRMVVLVAAVICAISADAAEAYACYTSSNTTLTFYYDNQRSSRPGTTYDLKTSWNAPDWYLDGTKDYVTKVVFNSSFAAARPTYVYFWFCGMKRLQSIVGVAYLNTSEVVNFGYLYQNCSSLTSIDVSHFDTSKATNMDCMFDRSGVTSLDLSNFNTSNVTSMYMMFNGCSGLTNLDLSSFNTAKVTMMASMFKDCTKLASLDLSSFNTAQVTNTSKMFESSDKLVTVYVGNEWTTSSVNYSADMFYNCTSIVGGKGTTFNANHIDKAYAHIDGGPSNPGYFTEKNAATRGDVDGDGGVDISDLTTLINYLLTGNATGVNLSTADCDNSGNVNISDVTTLNNYLLRGNW